MPTDFKAPSAVPGLTVLDVCEGTIGLGDLGHSLYDQADARLTDPALHARVGHWLAKKPAATHALPALKAACRAAGVRVTGNKKVLALRLALKGLPAAGAGAGAGAAAAPPASAAAPAKRKAAAAASSKSPLLSNKSRKHAKISPAASAPPAAPPAQQQQQQQQFEWLVMARSSPSCHGCYAGAQLSAADRAAMSSESVVRRCATEGAAVEAAVAHRDAECSFEDWAPEFYGEGGRPPFSSADGENYDDDEVMEIYLVSPAEQAAAAKKKVAAARRASLSAPPQKAHGGYGAPWPGRGLYGEAAKGTPKPALDGGLFCRNACAIPGAKASVVPADYPGSGQSGMLYRVQRVSDRNYLMRAFCGEGGAEDAGGGGDAVGARFVAFKIPRCYRKGISWVTPATLNDAGAAADVVDAAHAALFAPGKESCAQLLTGAALVGQCVAGVTRSIFINCWSAGGRSCGFDCAGWDGGAAARAIAATGGALRCFAMSESTVSEGVLTALAAGCPELRGLMLAQCDGVKAVPEGAAAAAAAASSSAGGAVAEALGPPSDAAIAAVLRACPKLEWLYVDVCSDPHRCGGETYFGDESWRALAEGACPNLKVLWVDAEGPGRDGRRFATRGDPALVRRAVGALGGSLKLLMINPGDKIKSRLVLGGTGKKADTLEGDPPPKSVAYSPW